MCDVISHVNYAKQSETKEIMDLTFKTNSYSHKVMKIIINPNIKIFIWQTRNDFIKHKLKDIKWNKITNSTKFTMTLKLMQNVDDLSERINCYLEQDLQKKIFSSNVLPLEGANYVWVILSKLFKN